MFHHSWVVIFVLQLSFFLIVTDADFGNCEFSVQLEYGRRYHINNREYPEWYQGRQSCHWIAKSDGRIRISCPEIIVPDDSNCTLNVLSIYLKKGSKPIIYCGHLFNKTLETTGNTLEVILKTTSDTLAGQFYCAVEAVQDKEEKSGRNSKEKPGQNEKQRTLLENVTHLIFHPFETLHSLYNYVINLL